MDRETAKEYIKGQLESYLQSKGINTRQNFKCLNPEHEDNNPSMSIDRTSTSGLHCKCFSCGAYYDTFDLIGIEYGIKDKAEIFKKAYDLFDLNVDNGHKTTTKEYQNQPKNERNTQSSIHNTVNTMTQQEDKETDYTDFFLQANKNLSLTSYHRGLSMETLNRFNVGYVENWKYPLEDYLKGGNGLTRNGKPRTRESWEYLPISPRLIIPTSKHSYLARDTRAELTKEQDDFKKPKIGKVRLFNSRALWESKQPIFIVEGEIDAMSFYEVGAEAVGLGGLNTRLLLTELEKQKPAAPLIIDLDNESDPEKRAKVENATNQLIEGLKRLDISCYRINVTQPYKDANEALNADRGAFAAAVEKAIDQVEDAELAALEAERGQLQREAVVYSLQSFIKDIEDSKRVTYIPTGFSNLDSLIDGGLYAGFYIVGAISSLGKTTFCLQIADNIAQAGHDVLIFSLEMARNELIAKSVSRITLIKDQEKNNSTAHAKTTRGILTGTRYAKYSKTEKDLIQESISAYSEYAGHIYITEGMGDMGIDDIRSRVQRHVKLTGKAPVVLIDYIQIIAPADVRATDKQNTDKAVLELKRLSRDYSIPVIGISSFNRDNYTEPVNLASFKESGAIEYSSDVLIGLQYEGMDYQEGEAKTSREKRIRNLLKQAEEDGKNGQPQNIQVKVLKNRNGRKGSVNLDFYPMFNYFKAQKTEEGEENNGWSRATSSYKS